MTKMIPALVLMLVLASCGTGGGAQTGPAPTDPDPVTASPVGESDPAEAAGSLVGTRWRPVGADDRVYVEFLGNGRFSGDGGCNGFGGEFAYLADGRFFDNWLRAGGAGMTRMACNGIADDLAMLDAIGDAVRYSIVDDRLTLTDAEGVEFSFDAVGPAEIPADPPVDTLGFIGLDEPEAAARAEGLGLTLRVVSVDGEGDATMELLSNRVNVELVDGRVAVADIY